MKELLTALLWHRSRLPLILVGAFAILLPVLAVVQYRWIGQLSEAERERLNARLKDSVVNFTEEFNANTARLYVSLLPNRLNEPATAEMVAKRIENWQNNNQHAAILKNVYRSSGGERGTENIETFDVLNHVWKATVWPAWLLKMREKAAWRAPNPNEPPGQRPFNLGRIPGQWFDDEATVLLAPRLAVDAETLESDDGRPRLVLEGWMIVEMNGEYLRTVYIPELAQKHFGSDYFIRIARRTNPQTVIYHSDETSGSGDFGYADATGTLYEVRPEIIGGIGQQLGLNIGPGGPRNFPGGPPPGRPRAGKKGGPGGLNQALQPPPAEGRGRWSIAARHKSGSLQRAVDFARYRNLGISFVILLLMAVTVVLIVAATQRAQHLVHLQMEFVASVSHELRTPLAVIRSAGENLADGLVVGDGQVRRYGSLIRNEGRRLSDMVEQIMSFAGLEKARANFEFTSVDIQTIVQRAMSACEPALRGSGCQVELELQDDLPKVLADANSLTHCLQNLLTNAAKYASQSGAIALKARKIESPKGPQLEISVEDHGPGIDSADLPHIFEPFYRGRRAVEDQIHGTGLGLSLVKRIVEAHSGRIEVVSNLGQGTIFTLKIPAVQPV